MRQDHARPDRAHPDRARAAKARRTLACGLIGSLVLLGGCQQTGNQPGDTPPGGISPIAGALGGAGAGALAGRLIAGAHGNTAAMLGGALIGGLGGLLGSSAYDRYKGEQNQNEDLTHQLSFEQNQAAQQQALNQQMQSQQAYNQWGQARGYYTPPVNQPGDVQTAQRLLIALGLYNGAIDGLNGPATAQAVQRFQTSHGLEPTGTVTPQLIQQMRQAVAS